MYLVTNYSPDQKKSLLHLRFKLQYFSKFYFIGGKILFSFLVFFIVYSLKFLFKQTVIANSII